MTTQLIARVSPQPTSTASSPTASQGLGIKTVGSSDTRLQHLMESYSVPSQVEYLHLQAEIEVLLQQLQTLKQQKLRGTDHQAQAN